jgi:dynein light chain Tctex-type 1
VTENAVTALTDMSQNFKYVVSCMIAEKVGAGFTSTSVCYWDSQSDGR